MLFGFIHIIFFYILMDTHLLTLYDLEQDVFIIATSNNQQSTKEHKTEHG